MAVKQKVVEGQRGGPATAVAPLSAEARLELIVRALRDAAAREPGDSSRVSICAGMVLHLGAINVPSDPEAFMGFMKSIKTVQEILSKECNNQELVWVTLRELYDAISDPNRTLSPVMSVVLQLMDVEAIPSAVKYILSSGHPEERLRKALHTLCTWLTRWTETPNLGPLVLEFMRGLEGERRFDMLLDITVETVDSLLKLMILPSARQSVGPVVLHMLHRAQHSAQVSEKVAPHAKAVLEVLSREQSPFAQALVEAREAPGGGGGERPRGPPQPPPGPPWAAGAVRDAALPAGGAAGGGARAGAPRRAAAAVRAAGARRRRCGGGARRRARPAAARRLRARPPARQLRVPRLSARRPRRAGEKGPPARVGVRHHRGALVRRAADDGVDVRRVRRAQRALRRLPQPAAVVSAGAAAGGGRRRRGRGGRRALRAGAARLLRAARAAVRRQPVPVRGVRAPRRRREGRRGDGAAAPPHPHPQAVQVRPVGRRARQAAPARARRHVAAAARRPLRPVRRGGALRRQRRRRPLLRPGAPRRRLVPARRRGGGGGAGGRGAPPRAAPRALRAHVRARRRGRRRRRRRRRQGAPARPPRRLSLRRRRSR